MTIWAPGMRCVCVDDAGHRRFTYAVDLPVKGRVYTVREVITVGGQTGLRLNEITNDVRRYLEGEMELAFHARRFRPLSETRLNQFRVHLNRRPVELPIADPLVLRPVSASGAATVARTAAPHSHPHSVASAAFQARRNVIAAGVAAPARPSVAAEVFEEIELSSSSCFHGSNFPWSALPCPTADFPRATIPQATK